MKSSSAAVRPSVPGPLRILHGIVFGGFTALCLVAGWPEWHHLVRSQLHPFHAGPPPRPALVLAGVVALLSLLVIVVQGLRGRGARLRWSGLILAALAVTLWGLYEGPLAGRTADSANLRILLVAQALGERTVSELQGKGLVPEEVEFWQVLLDEVSKKEPTPVRTRSFAPLPFRIQKVASAEALPPDAPPGTLLLFIAPGGAAYELHPVGLSPTGEPWRLKSPTGEDVVFRGAFDTEQGGAAP